MEYMAACMDRHIEASQHWYEEAFDNALAAIRKTPELSKVYAFMYTYCVFESSPRVMSLHWTKAGAYRAMNRYLFDEWHSHNTASNVGARVRGSKAFDCDYERWGVKEFGVDP